MKYLMLLSAIFPNILISQLNINAVICNQGNEALPLTNVVSLKSDNGTITDENGNFHLSNINTGDSLKITNVGYLPLVIPVNRIKLADTLFLTENTRQLNEIKLVSLKQYNSETQLGYYRYPENGEYKLKSGNEIALFIENSSKREGLIQGIYFRLKQKGICENGLRIRLLNKDAVNPDLLLDVIHDNIIISNKELKLRNYVDLKEQRIMLPADGIFIVIELLYPEKNCDKQSYTSISANMKENSNFVWLNYRDRKWNHSNIPRLPNERYLTPNIGLQVAY